MLNTLQKKISQVPSDFAYKLEQVKNTKRQAVLASRDQLIVDTINSEGVFVTSLEELGLTFTPQLLNAARSMLSSRASVVSNDYGNQSCFNFKQSQIVTEYPDIFLWGLQERQLNKAENYLRLPAAYHGVNFRIDFAADQQSGTQLWHRDEEDRRLFKMIVYLNDVTENNGPFEYIPRYLTPSEQSFKRIYRKILTTGSTEVTDEKLRKFFPELAWKSCIGPAGTVIFVDTRSVFHHGKLPEAERAALFFVYSSRNPKQPDLCKANLGLNKEQLIAIAKQLPQPQMECLLWERKVSKELVDKFHTYSTTGILT